MRRTQPSRQIQSSLWRVGNIEEKLSKTDEKTSSTGENVSSMGEKNKQHGKIFSKEIETLRKQNEIKYQPKILPVDLTQTEERLGMEDKTEETLHTQTSMWCAHCWWLWGWGHKNHNQRPWGTSKRPSLEGGTEIKN